MRLIPALAALCTLMTTPDSSLPFPASGSQLPASPRQIITARPAPVGPYSHAVKSGGFIYVSGTLAQDDSGEMVGAGDVRAQTKRVIERMREILVAAGSSLEQVVAVTVYLKSAGDFAAMSEVYRTFWPKDPPT